MTEPERAEAILAVAEHLRAYRQAHLLDSYQPPSFHAGVMAGLDTAVNEVLRLARSPLSSPLVRSRSQDTGGQGILGVERREEGTR